MTMEIYRCNRNCGCMRCRYRGSLWGVFLMVLGVLWLLSELDVRGLDLDRTWPMLLIVIGVIVMLQRTASMEGHVQPYAMMPGAPMYPVAPASAPTTSAITPADEVRHE